MKIRIKGNSVRLRLSKSETALFASEGIVEEKTNFGNKIFGYAVIISDANNMSATFSNNMIRLSVPKNLTDEWVTTSLISLEYNMPLDGGEHLHLLIEKDFKCVDAVNTEDQSDYFENPAKSC